MSAENPNWFIEESIAEYKKQAALFPPKIYEVGSDDELAHVHPWAKELEDAGIVLSPGKGFYRKPGANKTADIAPIRTDTVTPMIQLIQRTKSGLWAVPGGFIDPGEIDFQAAIREYEEETLEEIQNFEPTITRLYTGPVADIRMTANAWPETSAFLALLNPKKTKQLSTETMPGKNTDEVLNIGWFTLEQVMDKPMFGSHRLLAQLALESV